MATENTIMAAVLDPGRDRARQRGLRAACPGSLPLPRLLGAQIEGIESNVLRINGVDRLTGGEWTIGPDHIEVGSFIGMAAITGGDVTIDGVRAHDLVSILPAFKKLGVRVEIGEDSVHVPLGSS